MTLDEIREQNTATAIYGEYTNGKSYLTTMGLDTIIPKCVRYYEGKQWPTTVSGTEKLPRPVINFSKFVSRNKKSNVVNAPVKIVYKAEDGQSTDDLNAFLEYIFDELKIKSVDKRALSDGVKKGTYVYHFYWDNSKEGKNGVTTGGVNVELIEPLNVFFANPNEIDEQKQKWIIIATREELDAVKQMANNDLQISEDTLDSSYNEIEQEGTKYVTLLTKYFKVDGEVYFMKATKDYIVQEATPLNFRKRTTSDKPDEADTATASKPTNKIENPHKFNLYPIVVGNWEERDKSIYGISEVEEQLPNQDLINRSFAYQGNALRTQGLDGWIVKPGALKSEITNSPGEIITDHLPPGQKGIEKKPVNNIPSDNMNFANILMDNLRTVTGATEVMSGETISGNMSGTAIAALQAQSLQPMEEYKQRFWAVKEKQALVLMCFFRFFYDQTDFQTDEIVQDKNDPNVYTNQKVKKTFKPEDTYGHKYDVVAIAGQGTAYSELSELSIYQQLLEKGAISVDEFIELAPDKLLPNKAELIKKRKLASQQQVVILSQQVQKQKEQLLQAAQVITEQSKVIDDAKTIVNDNNNLRASLLEIQSKFIEAMATADEMIKQKDAERGQILSEASKFAEETLASQQKTTL
ncbi:MAG: hypothetical protein AB7E61_07205 [Acholeplasmataceae bacterium]